jgi:DegV family protein with EDD domain
MAYRIAVDSSSNLPALSGVEFASAPLSIITDERQYVDDENIDLEGMLKYLAAYKGRSGTSCPNVGEWLKAFGDAEGVFVVTITSSLSGSYGSALQAKEVYLQMHPERNVCVLDSLSTGPEMALIAEKLRELINSGLAFEEIEKQIREYMSDHTHLIFVLKNLNNMSRNGRVSPIVAKAVGLLGIHILGIASDTGTLQSLHKTKGEKSAVKLMLDEMKKRGFKGGKVRISHCQNSSGAVAFANLIREEFPFCDIHVSPATGLCSFYGEIGHIMVGYESE